jgi:hypothetical protein
LKIIDRKLQSHGQILLNFSIRNLPMGQIS